MKYLKNPHISNLILIIIIGFIIFSVYYAVNYFNKTSQPIRYLYLMYTKDKNFDCNLANKCTSKKTVKIQNKNYTLSQTLVYQEYLEKTYYKIIIESDEEDISYNATINFQTKNFDFIIRLNNTSYFGTFNKIDTINFIGGTVLKESIIYADIFSTYVTKLIEEDVKKATKKEYKLFS